MKKHFVYPLIILTLLLVAAACSTNRFRMANCTPVGEADGKKLFDCDAYKEPRGIERR